MRKEIILAILAIFLFTGCATMANLSDSDKNNIRNKAGMTEVHVEKTLPDGTVLKVDLTNAKGYKEFLGEYHNSLTGVTIKVHGQDVDAATTATEALKIQGEADKLRAEVDGKKIDLLSNALDKAEAAFSKRTTPLETEPEVEVEPEPVETEEEPETPVE